MHPAGDKGGRDMADCHGRRRVSAIVLSALVWTASTQSTAADQGNWTQGCAPGWVCHWEGAINGSAAVSSTARDSDFTGDTFVGTGRALNDRVKFRWNRFTSVSVRAYSAFMYGGTVWLCIGPGIQAGPYPLGVDGGMSSFKSC
jgi:hypothetical protein